MSDKKKIRTIDRMTDPMHETMDVVRLVESSDRSGVRNQESSAYGYYQFLEQVQKGINSNYDVQLTYNSREEQHEGMRLLMLENQKFLKRNGLAETTENYYTVHLLGASTTALKYIKARDENPNTPISNILTQKEINANAGYFKNEDGSVRSVGSANSVIKGKLDKGKQLIKSQPAERKREVEKEKLGIYEGRRTPLDIRPGNFKFDEKVEWHPNKAFFNGTKLGEQRMDYVIDDDGKQKKVLLAKNKTLATTNADYTPSGYDMSAIYEYDDKLWENNPNKSKSSGANYKVAGDEVTNFRNATYKYNGDQLNERAVQTGAMNPEELPKFNETELLQATGIYANPDNPNSSVGNAPHLMQMGPDGKPIILNDPKNRLATPNNNMNDPQLMEMINAVYGNRTPGVPQQQQFADGGPTAPAKKPRVSTSSISAAYKQKQRNESREYVPGKSLYTGGDGDSVIENVLEFIDPTGISSWDDVYRAIEQYGIKDSRTILEIMGAIPVVGKFGKLAKFGKLSDFGKLGKGVGARGIIPSGRIGDNISDLDDLKPVINRQFAQGGDMKKKQYEETDEGLITFNEGGTHEENPMGGIPQNTNPDGTLNTVEEGETKHQNYVFSDRLKVDEDIAEDLRLPKEVIGKTFAEASEYLNSFLEENENDAVVKRTVEKQLENLKVGNEKAREESNANDEMVRQAQYEKDHVDEINAQDQASAENVDTSLVEGEADSVPNQPTDVPQFGEEDMMQFAEGGWLKNVNQGGVVSGVGDGIGGLMAVTSEVDPNRDDKIKAGAVAGKGALAGMSAGATIGSAIPGVGTAIGAAAGAVVGGTVGLISGNKKAKQQKERWAREDDELFKTQTLDPRTVSGMREFASGGQMMPPPNFVNFNDGKSVEDFVPSFNLFPKAMYDGPGINANVTLGSENVVFNDDDTISIGNLDAPNAYEAMPELGARYADNFTGFDSQYDPEGYDGGDIQYTSDAGAPSKSFKPKGENLFQYAGLAGAYSNYKSAKAEKPMVESYRASGKHITPSPMDIDSIINDLRVANNTSNQVIVNNSGGNSSAARANVLASQGKVYGAMGDAYMKAQEYNNQMQMTADQYNNQIDQYIDGVYNKEAENNYQNQAAVEAMQRQARKDYIDSLSGFGRERSNRNAAYNMSGGYDRYGNFNTSEVEQIVNFLKRSGLKI